MRKIIVYHGSTKIIRNPKLADGKPYNDYGRGFYCTKDIELAKEWACKENKDGIVNEYLLNTNGLKILNLLDEKYSILNWIAILIKNRIFHVEDIGLLAKKYILNNYLINISEYDIVIGYRADDSYFSYAQAFLNNSLSLHGLEKALYLGDLGVQVVLVSEKAFENIIYKSSEKVDANIYFQKFYKRDVNARTEFKKIKSELSIKDDLYIMDLLRGDSYNG